MIAVNFELEINLISSRVVGMLIEVNWISDCITAMCSRGKIELSV